MAYTVKQLATLSGVSVRTLHFYDELELLKPAYYGANGYRFYEEPQLLALQQILFFRELGFELKAIKQILGRADFEVVSALESHRQTLTKNLARTRKLIATIDKTIEHLKGLKKMKSKQMFEGFDPIEQAKHEQYLINRYGEDMRKGIAESKKKVKHWKKADWEKSSATFREICDDFVSAIERKVRVEDPEVQSIVERHYHWLQQFWTPTRESYAGHSELIVDSDLRKAYEAHHPDLPEFVATAILRFSTTRLS